MRARSGSAIKNVYTKQIAVRKAESGLFNQGRGYIYYDNNYIVILLIQRAYIHTLMRII